MDTPQLAAAVRKWATALQGLGGELSDLFAELDQHFQTHGTPGAQPPTPQAEQPPAAELPPAGQDPEPTDQPADQPAEPTQPIVVQPEPQPTDQTEPPPAEPLDTTASETAAAELGSAS